MTKLWVVETQFVGDEWGVCNFTDYVYAGTKFVFVHAQKRKIQKYLKQHNPKHWIKKRFRVKEYISIDNVVLDK